MAGAADAAAAVPAGGAVGCAAAAAQQRSGIRRRRRRTFAWQSSPSSSPSLKRCRRQIGGAPQDGATASKADDLDDRQNTEDASEGDDFRSSSASSSPMREAADEGETVVFHSTVAEADSYLEVRERSAAAVSSRTSRFRTPPPLGAAAVERRRRRLLSLRKLPRDHGGAVGRLPWPAPALQEAAAQLRGRGFVVVDGFLSDLHARELRDGVLQLPMQPWQLSDSTSTIAIRGDLVAWPDMQAPTSFGDAVRRWIMELDSLVHELAALMARPAELGKVTAREAPMATCYPTGTSIIRHYDNNCEDGTAGDCNGRRLTTIYYLNDAWSDEYGGHLRLFGQRGRTYDVRPTIGVLVLFWADRRTAHEVLPNRGPRRYALSCWYVDSDEVPKTIQVTPIAMAS